MPNSHDYRNRTHDELVDDLNAAFRRIRALYVLVALSIGMSTVAILGELLLQW